MTRLFLALLLLPLPALADDCHDRIAAMFDGGPLDPFAMTPHQLDQTTYGADGAVRWVYHGRIQSPVRMVGGLEGGTMALIVGSDSWMGPGFDGPWSPAPNMVPEDHEGYVRQQVAQKIANLSDTHCDGIEDVDGQPRDKIRFFTKTDPNPLVGGAWFGGQNVVWIDPDTQRVAQWEFRDTIAHYMPDPSPDWQRNLYSYDPTITVNSPE